MRLLVAIPSCRDWKVAFGSSLVGLTRKLSTDATLEAFDMYIMQGASVLPKARQIAIDTAIKQGFTHILFLDDDMAFPADLVNMLARHGKQVVGVNYTRKTMNNPSTQTHGLDGQLVYSFGKSGAEEVGWLGFGAVLIDLAAIKDIEAPLFEMRWHSERGDFVGEDYYFCGKVREHGVRVYVDHDASNMTSHIGDYAYREQVAQKPLWSEKAA